MKNKKGAEMTIGTIVLIVLALIVLVVLIYGFTTGWGNLWQNIVNFGGGKVNVQTIIQSCELACSTNQVYDYCTKTRDVLLEGADKAEPLTCFNLQDKPNVDLECDKIICPK